MRPGGTPGTPPGWRSGDGSTVIADGLALRPGHDTLLLRLGPAAIVLVPALHGVGYQDLLFAFQIGFVGSLAFGSLHVVLALRPGLERGSAASGPTPRRSVGCTRTCRGCVR